MKFKSARAANNYISRVLKKFGFAFELGDLFIRGCNLKDVIEPGKARDFLIEKLLQDEPIMFLDPEDNPEIEFFPRFKVTTYPDVTAETLTKALTDMGIDRCCSVTDYGAYLCVALTAWCDYVCDLKLNSSTRKDVEEAHEMFAEEVLSYLPD